MAQKKVPQIGDDVTALMRGNVEGPSIGADVTSLMTPRPKSLSGFLTNLTRDVGENIEGLATGGYEALKYLTEVMALSPEGIRKSGAIAKALPSIPGALAQTYKERYGQGLGSAAYENPIDVLLDAATLAGGVGAVAKGAQLPKIASAAKTIERLANPAEIATQVGVKAAKTVGPKLQNLAVGTTAKTLHPTEAQLKSLPSRYGPRDMPDVRMEQVAKELLEGGFMPTKGGRSKAKKEMDLKAAEAKALLASSTKMAPTGKYFDEEFGNILGRYSEQSRARPDITEAQRAIDDILDNSRLAQDKIEHIPDPKFLETAKRQVDPAMFQVLIEKGEIPTTPRVVGREFLEEVPVQVADLAKRRTYEALGEKAGPSGAQMTTPSGTAIEKAAARAERRAIEEVEPGIIPIHQRESQMRDLLDFLNTATFQKAKQSPIGFGEHLAYTGYAPWLLPNVLLRHPRVGAPLAQGAWKAGKALSGAQMPPEELFRMLLGGRFASQEPK